MAIHKSFSVYKKHGEPVGNHVLKNTNRRCHSLTGIDSRQATSIYEKHGESVGNYVLKNTDRRRHSLIGLDDGEVTNLRKQCPNKQWDQQCQLQYKHKHKHKPISKNFIISTYNVRTLYQIGKFHQLAKGCHKIGLHFVAIQEHRWTTDNEIDSIYTDDGNYLFVYASADRKRNGGVGLLIHKAYVSQIKSIKKISSRIILINFDCNPQLTIISAYAPTNIASETDKVAFYDLLEYTINSIPQHNLLFVAGDFNAQIGSDSHMASPRTVGRSTYYDKTNSNGEKLISLCESTSLRPLQNRFLQPKNRQWTWSSPNGARHQLDHLLIRSKWVNSVRNCRAYASVELDSDHRILSANIKLSLKCDKKSDLASGRYNWQPLIDPNNQNKLIQEYEIKIQNSLKQLYNANENQSSQIKYDHFVSCVAKANETFLSKIKRKKHIWVSTKTELLCEERDQAKRKYLNTKIINDYNKWRKLCREVSDSFKKDKKKHFEELGIQAGNAYKENNMKNVYEIINIISGKFKKNTAIGVRKRDGNLPENTQELTNEWKLWFEEILNKNNNIRSYVKKRTCILPINIGNFTEEEIRLAIKELKNGKAAGIDKDITAEALKAGGSTIVTYLCDICNSVLNNNDPPSQWTTNLIIPIPKKNSTNMADFRGISLMSISAKVYNKALLNRIYDPVNSKLTSNQAGFRKNMSCTQQICALRRIIEGANNKQLPLITTFIDFQRAFDSINRETIWKILRYYGVPEKIIAAIRCIYDESKSKVIIGKEISDTFRTSSGILQGDTLSPFIFVIVMDYILSRINIEKGFTLQEAPLIQKIISHLAFADDIVLINNKILDAYKQIKKLSHEAVKVGLDINTKKTKFMTNIAVDKNLHKMNELIEKVEHFKYLGSSIESSINDIKTRKAKAWNVFWQMKKLWSSNEISLKLKLNILNGTCFAILLYGSESWIIDQEAENIIDRFALACYRHILKLRISNKIRNENILRQIGQNKLSQTVKIRQLNFIGEQLRKENIITKDLILYDPINGYNKVGRPKLTFVKYIQQILNKNINEITEISKDENKWNILITNIISNN